MSVVMARDVTGVSRDQLLRNPAKTSDSVLLRGRKAVLAHEQGRKEEWDVEQKRRIVLSPSNEGVTFDYDTGQTEQEIAAAVKKEQREALRNMRSGKYEDPWLIESARPSPLKIDRSAIEDVPIALEAVRTEESQVVEEETAEDSDAEATAAESVDDDDPPKFRNRPSADELDSELCSDPDKGKTFS